MSFINILLRIVGVAGIIFVLYKIISLILGDENWLFGRKSDGFQKINAKNIDIDIHGADLSKLISDAINRNNYRLATRFYYLLSLKHLSENDIISWDNEKTNHDYFLEIKEKDLKKQFQYISYLYDYCWYGEFELNESSFNEGKTAFEKIISMSKR